MKRKKRIWELLRKKAEEFVGIDDNDDEIDANEVVLN